MKALLVRYVHFAGVGGTILVIGSLLLLLVVTLTDSWSRFNLSYGVVCGVLAVGQMVVAGVRYRRSRAVEQYEPVVDALVANREAFCLILRPFGWDGEIVLPRSDRKGRLSPVNGFTPNLTLEQVIARAARATSAMPVYAIVDQRKALAPPGPTFMRVPDTEWQDVAARLIRMARSIVLVVPTASEDSAGFTWEIEQIIDLGLAHRVIVALPPYDSTRPHREVLRRACGIVARIGGAVEESDAENVLRMVDPTSMLIHIGTDWRIRWWSVVDMPAERTKILRRIRRTVVSEKLYAKLFSDALATQGADH